MTEPAATERPFATARLDELERVGNWIPIRRHFGIAAFGVNAWVGDDGAEVISTHDEARIGHEELYLVISGRAEFTIRDDTVDAPAGTIVFVRDPAARRGAVAREDGTTVLTVGAKPGEPFTPSAWEENADILPLFEEGRFEEAAARLRAVHEREPGAGGILYNLACAEARLGETDAAIEHLRRAIEIEPRFAELARDDEDFAAIRDDPRFPPA
jgi:tetratricopeptide (TPR) repeat protein